MSILADISKGNTGFADVCFLIGLILFLIAGFLAYRPVRADSPSALWGTAGCLGLAAESLGLLVL